MTSLISTLELLKPESSLMTNVFGSFYHDLGFILQQKVALQTQDLPPQNVASLSSRFRFMFVFELDSSFNRLIA